MLVMISCNDVTTYIPSKNLEQALQGSKILDFWRVYMLLHHYKISLQVLQGKCVSTVFEHYNL